MHHRTGPGVPGALGAAFLVLAGLAATAAVPAPAGALSPTIVISQVYGGGGNAGAPYRNDFVELFNRGPASASLAGWSLQYASATGTGTFGANPVAALSGALAPGQYALVQMASGGGNGVALPAPDGTGSANMSAAGGKVALVSSTTGLACNGGSSPCNPDQLATIVDLVGWGSANFYEGASPAPATTNTTAILRGEDSCAETDVNGSDFAAGPPNPRNSASPLSPCGPPAASPTVTLDPVDAAVPVGTTATFSAAASGVPDPTVIWQESIDSGGTWSDVAGAEDVTLSFTASADQDGNRYRAVFNNSSGSTPSAAATLTVTTPPVVVSQVYGGGGNAGATLRHDYIELFNRGITTVDLSGWSVQYAATTGVTWSKTDLGGTIGPRGYYLIRQAQGVGGTEDLPAPDASGTIPMAQARGKVVLVSSQVTVATGTSCPTGPSVVDLVGYGSGTDCHEGTGPTGTLSSTTAAVRQGGGDLDTDDNGTDFTVESPNPRNSSTPEPTPTPTPTSTPEPTPTPTPEPTPTPTPEPDNRAPVFPGGDERRLVLSPGALPPALDAVDPDGDPLAYAIVAGTLPDGLVLNADGTWSGTPPAILVEVPLTVLACDPAGACATQTVVLAYQAAMPDTATEPQPTDGSPPAWLIIAAAVLLVVLVQPGWPRSPASASRRSSIALSKSSGEPPADLPLGNE